MDVWRKPVGKGELTVAGSPNTGRRGKHLQQPLSVVPDHLEHLKHPRFPTSLVLVANLLLSVDNVPQRLGRVRPRRPVRRLGHGLVAVDQLDEKRQAAWEGGRGIKKGTWTNEVLHHARRENFMFATQWHTSLRGLNYQLWKRIDKIYSNKE